MLVAYMPADTGYMVSVLLPCVLALLTRSVSRHFEESVGARITVLEGKLKLMEAQVGHRH